MSKYKLRVASYILREQFGEILEDVAVYLAKKGARHVKDIAEGTNQDKTEVKKALSILMKHDLLTCEPLGEAHYTYKILEDNILLRLRHPRFIYITKVRYGDIGELIVEELLAEGYDIISRVVNKVIQKQVQDAKGEQVNPSLNDVVQKFLDLVNDHVVKRVKSPILSQDNKSVKDGDIDEFVVPANIVPGIGHKRKATGNVSNQPPEKRFKSDDSNTDKNQEYVDEGVYWYINFEKLNQLILDDLIVSAAGTKVDQTAGKIIQTMLTRFGDGRDTLKKATKTVASFEVLRKIPVPPKMSQDEVSQYLSLLADERTGGFLQKTDETGGGTYCVNLHKCVEILCQVSVESFVQERFGSKALRIFRLLLMKKYLEQKQIGELAMIPFKETKELLYTLMKENLVKLQEISKAGDFAPARTFYLFGVDLTQVSRLVLEKSYQAIGNMLSRRELEVAENKRILEKNEKIDALLATIESSEENAEVTQEIEELITPAEKDQLEKLKIDLTRIEHGEIQVDETVYILQQYLSFN